MPRVRTATKKTLLKKHIYEYYCNVFHSFAYSNFKFLCLHTLISKIDIKLHVKHQNQLNGKPSFT